MTCVAQFQRGMKQILVTGATGTVGGQVVSQLLATDVRVRALTRAPSLARLPDGIDIRRGDLYFVVDWLASKDFMPQKGTKSADRFC
ncbi:MAG TPA: NmrA family NAD(P)-binding protein [Pyrinomonadaceae bacterium]|nr:NmrA family NAD(P)-binding protein [Pyrinomonadaceae bacterium]